jgi:hypothetical protein
MDTLNSSKLAIHKEVSVSVSQIETPSPPIELDSASRLELDTTRGNAINDVVAMFELEASPNDDERRPNGTPLRGGQAAVEPAHETPRNELSWDEIPSPERRAPDIPILEVLPDQRAADIVHTESSAPERPPPQFLRSNPRVSGISATEIPSAEGSEPFKPTSAISKFETYTPVAGRAQTPIPTISIPEISTLIPPMPATSTSIVPTPETSVRRMPSLASERPSLESPPLLESHSEAGASERPVPERQSPPHIPIPEVSAPERPSPHVPASERPAPEKPTSPG